MAKRLWTESLEQLILTWAEKASGYAWLHQNSCSLYKKRNLYISIPASIFSYIAGITVLFSNELTNNNKQIEIYNKTTTIHENDSPIFRIVVGIIAIVAGILSNFQEMFTFKEEGEKHRIAALRFLSFFREISCELSLEPSFRSSTVDYITIKRFEFDKILEQSPNIPDIIIHRFNKKFGKLHIHKPDPTIGLQTIIPYGRDNYKKSINIDEKFILLKYFEYWKSHTTFNRNNGSHVIEIANSGSTDCNISNIKTRTLSERDATHLLYHGTLSTQKRFLQNRNIKIRRPPLMSSAKTLFPNLSAINNENNDNSL
jgi:hypothetical protein